MYDNENSQVDLIESEQIENDMKIDEEYLVEFPGKFNVLLY